MVTDVVAGKVMVGCPVSVMGIAVVTVVCCVRVVVRVLVMMMVVEEVVVVSLPVIVVTDVDVVVVGVVTVVVEAKVTVTVADPDAVPEADTETTHIAKNTTANNNLRQCMGLSLTRTSDGNKRDRAREREIQTTRNNGMSSIFHLFLAQTSLRI